MQTSNGIPIRGKHAQQHPRHHAVRTRKQPDQPQRQQPAHEACDPGDGRTERAPTAAPRHRPTEPPPLRIQTGIRRGATPTSLASDRARTTRLTAESLRLSDRATRRKLYVLLSRLVAVAARWTRHSQQLPDAKRHAQSRIPGSSTTPACPDDRPGSNPPVRAPPSPWPRRSHA